jgi:hypothetical protein
MTINSNEGTENQLKCGEWESVKVNGMKINWSKGEGESMKGKGNQNQFEWREWKSMEMKGNENQWKGKGIKINENWGEMIIKSAGAEWKSENANWLEERETQVNSPTNKANWDKKMRSELHGSNPNRVHLTREEYSSPLPDAERPQCTSETLSSIRRKSAGLSKSVTVHRKRRTTLVPGQTKQIVIILTRNSWSKQLFCGNE